MACEHWQDCGITGGGCCGIKAYDRPSLGTCRQCPKNTAAGQWPLVTLTTPADLSRTSPAALPVNQWPRWARWLEARRQPGEVGAGDTLARILDGRGGAAYKRWFKAITGVDCGCEDRRARLTIAYSYSAESLARSESPGRGTQQ
jgi:hypothetical protein